MLIDLVMNQKLFYVIISQFQITDGDEFKSFFLTEQ